MTSSPALEFLMNTIASLTSTFAADGPTAESLSSPRGIVAGTVLRAARLSAGLAQGRLAAAIDTDAEAVGAWEDGTEALATLPYPVVERFGSALADAGADPALVADLTTAIWCDLVIEAMTDSKDLGCLMSDPIAAEQAFAELIAWSISGDRPARYSPYVGPGPLIIDCAFKASAAKGLSAAWPVPSPRAA